MRRTTYNAVSIGGTVDSVISSRGTVPESSFSLKSLRMNKRQQQLRFRCLCLLEAMEGIRG